MTALDNSLLLGAPASASSYQISRSLRFNSSDSAYLSRTPASAGNRKTWTWAGWVKRSVLGSRQNLFGTADSSFYNGLWLEFFSSDTLRLGDIGASTLDLEIITTQVFRDASAWGHIVVAFDTTQSTASNRIKIYFNGAQITTFSTATYPSQNFDTRFNTNAAHGIGRAGSYNAQYFNGYLADIHFIDGQALDPTSFGEFDTNGIWQPKQYTGTYGTNGFKLNFSDNSTAAALGTDTSGNGNTWTVNNLSVTAGAGNDSFVDTPTSYGTDTGVGGEVRGNFCTLNPLIPTGSTLSNGNLDYASAATYQAAFGTFGVRTGKWYFEGTVGTFATDALIGVSSAPFSTTTYVGGTATSWGYEGALGRIYNSASGSAYGATFGASDVIAVAFDADTGKLWFAKNGTWQASGDPATGANPAVTLTTGIDYFFGVSAGNGGTWWCNWGARPFAYTAPSGFKALCTANLPAPVVTKPSTVFDTVLWTGNDTGQTITMPGAFSPDLVWTKMRSAVNAHWLFDVIRGTNQGLSSSSTTNELTRSSSVTAFGSTGFTLGTSADVNSSAYTYVAWCWDAGSSTVTNTAGTIQSTVRANASAGFSVVTYTGTSANATVGHGLGVAPQFLIVKQRNGINNWWVYHQSLGASQYINLETTGAAATAGTVWNNTNPTSTVFSIGSVTSNGNTVAYCFAPVAGYSSFGSYTGNGNASNDGPFVYTGFRPRWVMIKSTSSGNWTIFDALRVGYNVDNEVVYPNLASGSGVDNDRRIDILSNGFKIRNTAFGSTDINGTTATTYIYAAFAEAPFQYARAR